MWFLILVWLPFVLLVAGYLCSWPRRASWLGVLCFDGPVLLLLLATPVLHYSHPEWFAVNETDLLETRVWLPLIVPLLSTVYALPIVFTAWIARYFIFRHRTPTA